MQNVYLVFGQKMREVLERERLSEATFEVKRCPNAFGEVSSAVRLVEFDKAMGVMCGMVRFTTRESAFALRSTRGSPGHSWPLV